MSGLNGCARFLLRLASRIAGRDREEWMLAMAAETDAAVGHGTGWAFGCLYAAARDRIARDLWFIITLFALPVLALALIFPIGIAVFIGSRAIGVVSLAFIPLMFSAELAAAWLLGRMRPDYAPIVIGTVAFLLHQAIPLLLMWAAFGVVMPFWSANMTYYGMPAPAGVLTSWLIWLAGTWWGGRTRRTAA